MKPSREQYKKVLEDTPEMAKQLQLVFPDPRDAIMSLALILTGLTRSIGMPLEKVVELVIAINDTMTDSSDEEHPMH